MWKRSMPLVGVHKLSAHLLGSGLLLATACSTEKPTGPINVQLVQPTGEHCKYVVSPATLHTLDSLTEMRGSVGRVVRIDENLHSRKEILDLGAGFGPITVHFAQNGNLFAPLDLHSLFAVSLYYSVERAHSLFAALDPLGDLSKIVPNFSETTIVHEARRTFGKSEQNPESSDNAEYLPHRVQTDAGQSVKNYIFSFPTETVKGMPLGLNLGIMVHEYTHFVFQHLFYEVGFKRNVGVSSGKPTLMTIGSFDEGNADYFGFLATRDPGFFLCSFPNENRDLATRKYFTDDTITRLTSDENFDIHEGGGIWGAIQYEIGRTVGFEENGRQLIRLMSQLLDCGKTGTNSISLDFADVANCHIKLFDSGARSSIASIYNLYMGRYRVSQ